MLVRLEAEDLLLVKELELDFQEGLNVLTGETGAGKSLLLDALRLVLGGRGGGELVRQGASVARVRAIFQPTDCTALQPHLSELGLPSDDDELLIQRELGADGRGSVRVNGQLVTVSMLRRLGGALVTVAGQGSQHRFTDPSAQLAYLDRFGGVPLLELAQGTAAAFQRWTESRRTIESLGGESEDLDGRRDFLVFQVREIDAFDPRPGEEGALERRREVLHEADRIRAVLEAAMTELRDGEAPVGERLGQLARELATLERLDARLSEPASLLQEAAVAVEEGARALDRYLDGFSFDRAEQAAVEERWRGLQDLKRKYGGSLEQVLALRVRLAAELDLMGDRADRLREATEEMHARARDLAEVAERLTSARTDAAQRLERAVEGELAALGLGGACFRVEVHRTIDLQGITIGGETVAVGPSGVDRVQFLWGANPGEALGPLARVASGGELARLLLVLYALRASESDVPTMVFDEVDAGVGGRAADAVAGRLAHLARSRQVLCVTHLAVVAAAADRHFTVRKEVSDGRTTVQVNVVRGAERVQEIARMLDGDRGVTSRQHATELLQRGSFPQR